MKYFLSTRKKYLDWLLSIGEATKQVWAPNQPLHIRHMKLVSDI